MNKAHRVFKGAFALLCLGLTPVSAQTLVAHYEFEDIANPGLDTSGNGNHMVSEAPPTQVAGRVGWAVSFDGANYLADGGHDIMAGFDGGFSYAGWFQSEISSKVGFRISSRTSLGGFAFTDKNGVPRHISYGSVTGVVDSSGDPTDTVWEHVVVTVDASGLVTFYRNGTLAGTGTLEADPGSSSNRAVELVKAGALTLGARNYRLQDSFRGQMDDVRFYKGVLSPEAVGRLYSDSLRSSEVVADVDIPEPRFYGLLLGLIALGCLAVRRRL